MTDAIELRWTAPENCPGTAALREAIESNLARDEFGPGLEAVKVQGDIEGTAPNWRLRVSVRLPGGQVEREVTSSRCEELAAAAGLIIAVALDPLRVVETIETARAAEPAPPAAPPLVFRPVEPMVRDADEPPSDSGRAVPRPGRLHADVRVGGVAEYGSVDALRGGVTGSAGLVGPWYRADLGLQYWAPRRITPFGAEPDAGVSIQQAGVGGRGCLMPRLGPIELASCVGFEGGAAIARGIGVDRSRLSSLPWAAAVFGQELGWISNKRVGLWAGADAMLHVVRPRYTLADLGQVVQTGFVGVRAVAGVAMRL